MIGTIIGDWRIEASIGRGAFGSVWLARHTRNREAAVIKVLIPGISRDPAIRVRLRETWSLLSHLDHPYIVNVIDTVERGSDLCLVMEKVEGTSLEHRLNAGPMEPEAVAEMGRELASALAAAHSAGVIHRDVTPSNIYVGTSGARLANFGIALAVQEAGLVEDGFIPGTPAYLAPELYEGRPATPAVDVYALGLVLHRCLTPTMTFRAPEKMPGSRRVFVPEVPDVRRLRAGVSDRLAEAIRMATHRDPNVRPPNGSALLQRLLEPGTQFEPRRIPVEKAAEPVETEPRPFVPVSRSSLPPTPRSSLPPRGATFPTALPNLANLAFGLEVPAGPLPTTAAPPATENATKEEATEPTMEVAGDGTLPTIPATLPETSADPAVPGADGVEGPVPSSPPDSPEMDATEPAPPAVVSAASSTPEVAPEGSSPSGTALATDQVPPEPGVERHPEPTTTEPINAVPAPVSAPTPDDQGESPALVAVPEHPIKPVIRQLPPRNPPKPPPEPKPKAKPAGMNPTNLLFLVGALGFASLVLCLGVWVVTKPPGPSPVAPEQPVVVVGPAPAEPPAPAPEPAPVQTPPPAPTPAPTPAPALAPPTPEAPKPARSAPKPAAAPLPPQETSPWGIQTAAPTEVILTVTIKKKGLPVLVGVDSPWATNAVPYKTKVVPGIHDIHWVHTGVFDLNCRVDVPKRNFTASIDPENPRCP